MYAFPQILTGDPIAIIRCGPCAINYRDPYEYAVVMEVLGQTALIHALVAEDPPEGRFSMRYAAPIIDIAKRFGKVDWERVK